MPPTPPMPIARVESILTITCCSTQMDRDIPSTDVDPQHGGRELAKAVCDRCGSEYMFGVIARTREQSLADDAFEHVSDEALDEIGVDRDDFDPSADEPRMCVRCDGTASADDLCRGCGEYVHAVCRVRIPRRVNAAHAAEEHWEEPKVELTVAALNADVDDGSVLTGDDRLDFVAED